MEELYSDSAGFEKIYDEINEICREAWKIEDYIFSYVKRSQSKRKETILIVMQKSRKKCIELTPQAKAFVLSIFLNLNLSEKNE